MMDASSIAEPVVSLASKRETVSSSTCGNTIVVRLLLLWCAAFLLIFTFWASSASAGTGYVDGISDQSLPAWDNNFAGSYFAGFFQGNWINPTPHIQYARYVAQWNVMTEVSGGPNPNGNYRERFEAWLGDAAGMGLTLDVSLTSYNGVYPPSSAAYKTQVLEVLKEADLTLNHPIRYLEAWNEPNGQGNESEVNAAHFTNEAYSACESMSPKCTIVAGNAEDNTGAKAYEEKYRANLNPVPTVWGIHPYDSVEHMEESYYTKAVEGLPSKGSGDQIWFSEVAARECTSTKNNEEAGQAERARWLVDTLMRNQKPEHVFYWEFLLKDRIQPTCAETDDALFVPSNDSNAPDAPRPAAAFIYGGSGFPWGYTGAPSSISTPNATLTASVYPGGLLDAKYHFEYGTSTSYGLYSSEGNAGSANEKIVASVGIGDLAPGTTYHFRIVTWNTEGSEQGDDETFHTQPAPEAVTGMASGIQEIQATLNGTLNPNGLDTHYYYRYGTSTTNLGLYAPASPGDDAGSGSSLESVPVIVEKLEPATTYYYQLVARSSAGETPGKVESFVTLGASMVAASREASTGHQWAFYRGGDGALWEWSFTGSAWTDSRIGGQIAPGSSPVVVHEGGVWWVFYQGSDGALWEYSLSGSTWTDSRIGGQLASFTSPVVVHEGGGWWVFYQGSDGALWEYSLSGSAWTDSRIGGQIAPGWGPAVVHEDGGWWVYYQGHEGEIWQWSLNGSTWTDFHLAPTPTPGTTAPVVVRESYTGYQWIFYRGGDGALWEWSFTGSAWTDSRIGGQIAPGTSPVVVHEGGGWWVFYQGSDGALWEYSLSGSTWADSRIGGQLAPGSSPVVVHEGGGWWVFYQGSEGQLWEYSSSGSTWTGYKIGGQIAPGSSPVVVHEGGGWWVFYQGNDGALWEYSLSGSTWTDYKIGGQMAPDANPVVAHEPIGNVWWVYYQDSEASVWQWSLSGGAWVEYLL